MATPKKVARKVAAKSTSQSKKAGLVFPVGKIASALRKGRYCPRVSRGAAIFLAGCLEYLTSEVLEVAAKAVLQRGKSKRITPRALTLAVRHDADSRGGVVPKVEKAIEAKKKSKATKKKSSATPKV
jgi:histone H2A